MSKTSDVTTKTDPERIAMWVGGALVAAIVVMLVVRAATSDWLAAGDFAVMRMRTLDVGTSNTPFVGVYSRYGWDHPGPMMFAAYAPFLRVVGGASYGLLLGALAVNLAAIGAVLWLARRAGAIAFATFAAVLAVIVFAFGAEELFDPWNPYVIILPLVAAGVAAWRCVAPDRDPDRVAAIVLVISASFATQTHIGGAVMAATMLVIGAFGIVQSSWWARDDATRDRSRRTGLIALAVGVVCWIPPVLQQLFPGAQPGNLRQIASFFLHGTEPVVGLAGALRLASRLLTLPPRLSVGWSMFPGDRAAIPWIGLLLVVTTAWAWRRGGRAERTLHVVAWASIGAFVIGASRVAGAAYPYLFRWGWVAVVLVGAAIVSAVAAMAVGRWPARVDVVRGVLGAVAALALVGTLVAGVDMTALDGWSDEMRAHEALIDPTLEAVGSAPSPTIIGSVDAMVDGTVVNQLLFEAGQRGIDLRATWSDAYIYGAHRVVEPESAHNRLIVAPTKKAAAILAETNGRGRIVAADADVTVILIGG